MVSAARLVPGYKSTQSLLRRQGVISAPRLHFVVGLAADFDAPEATVSLVVGRGVAQAVLSAQLVGDLIERGLHLFAIVAHFDYSTACLLGQLLHLVFAGVTAAIKPAVGNQQDVTNGIGLLRCLDGIANS